MSYMKWTSDLELGIEVIDKQHLRIVEYINDLHLAIDKQSRAEVGEVLEQLVEYTMSHFAFEEDLLEQAGYPFHHAHKKVHELFCRKIEDFQHRFDLGEDVSRHLLTTLRAWLINHIKRDDADYAEAVKVALAASLKPRPKSFFARLFG